MSRIKINHMRVYLLMTLFLFFLSTVSYGSTDRDKNFNPQKEKCVCVEIPSHLIWFREHGFRYTLYLKPIYYGKLWRAGYAYPYPHQWCGRRRCSGERAVRSLSKSFYVQLKWDGKFWRKPDEIFKYPVIVSGFDEENVDNIRSVLDDIASAIRAGFEKLMEMKTKSLKGGFRFINVRYANFRLINSTTASMFTTVSFVPKGKWGYILTIKKSPSGKWRVVKVTEFIT